MRLSLLVVFSILLGVVCPATSAGQSAAATAAGSQSGATGATGVAVAPWAERVLARLTLEEKVGQLVVSWLDGGRPEEGSARLERAVRLVEEQRVGGFIVGVGSGVGTAAWLEELQRRAAVPLLVAADLEWGPGTRLRGATVLPVAMAQSAAGGPGVAYEAGRITALEARAAGIHMAFAPVADVNINPRNPVINTRSYGSDPGGVAARVSAFVAGASAAGLLTVAKHFPGHGDTETDSHLALPVLKADRLRLEVVELRPFRAAIAAGVDGVMTAHVAVPALEDAGAGAGAGRRDAEGAERPEAVGDPRDAAAPVRPATLSPAIVTGLLRGELGYDGLVVTDGLHMDGVMASGEPGEVAVAALEAGADVLLIPPDEEAVIRGVVAALRSGRLEEGRIDASVRRVLAAKAAAGLEDREPASLLRLVSQVGRASHEAWARRVAERSITVPRGGPGTLPVRVRGRRVLLIAYDDARRHQSGEVLAEALTERGAAVRTVRLSRRSGPGALGQAWEAAEPADMVVFASYSRAVPWRGELGLPAEVAALADRLAADGAVVVSFGDPYILRQLPDAGTYVLAWSRARASQVAAVRALAGETPITGRLPIDLPPDYRVGDGLRFPPFPADAALPVPIHWRHRVPRPEPGLTPLSPRA